MMANASDHSCAKAAGSSDLPNEFINQITNNAALCGVVGVFGIVNNIITISVFLKQGINNTLTISFLGLAISDICSLLCLFWVIISLDPFSSNRRSCKVRHIDFVRMTAGWPRGCFGNVTSLVTAYVAGERCLCVIAPLTVRKIITPGRTVLAVAAIYFLMMVCIVPEYLLLYLDSNLTDETSEYVDDKRSGQEGVTSLLYSVFGLLSFLLVIFFTLVLVWKLRRANRWRQQNVHDADQVRGLSVREKKTAKMVILLACILIVCYTPSTVTTVLEFAVHEFSAAGDFKEVFFSMWAASFVCDTLDASTSVIFYYLMSSKFRETFHQMYGKCSYYKT